MFYANLKFDVLYMYICMLISISKLNKILLKIYSTLTT